jgi:hypothetical protein
MAATKTARTYPLADTAGSLKPLNARKENQNHGAVGLQEFTIATCRACRSLPEDHFGQPPSCDSIAPEIWSRRLFIASKANMKCPYCAEDIKDEAVVCKHCQRDFFIILPLLKALNDMGKRIEALEAEIANPTLLENAVVPPGPPARIVAPGTVRNAIKMIPGLSPLVAVVTCVIALVVAHFFIVVQYDLRIGYLRIALFALPLLFGLLFRDDGQRHMLWDIIAGLAVSVLSTFAMLAVVARTDQVSIMPADFGEWKELGYYVASIAFGFFTGTLLRQVVAATVSPIPPRNRIVALTSQIIAARLAGGEPSQLEKNLKRAQTIISVAMAISSAIISVASGLGITGGDH